MKVSYACAIVMTIVMPVVLVVTGAVVALLTPPFEMPIPRARVPLGWVVIGDAVDQDGWALRSRDPRSGLHFVLVPAGVYRVGARSTGRHREDRTDASLELVDVPRPFYVATTEVPVAVWAQYARAAGVVTHAETCGSEIVTFVADHSGSTAYARPRFTRTDGVNWRQPLPPEEAVRRGVDCRDPTLPVVHVTWHESRGFCQMFGYELPTELQWEIAATGHADFDDRTFAWGDDAAAFETTGNGRDLSCLRWIWGRNGIPADLTPRRDFVHDDGFVWLAPCGSFAATGPGCHDLHGNAAEWLLEDGAADLVTAPPPPDPELPGLFKNGSCFGHPYYLRTRQRHCVARDYSSEILGFRPVHNL